MLATPNVIYSLVDSFWSFMMYRPFKLCSQANGKPEFSIVSSNLSALWTWSPYGKYSHAEECLSWMLIICKCNCSISHRLSTTMMETCFFDCRWNLHQTGFTWQHNVEKWHNQENCCYIENIENDVVRYNVTRTCGPTRSSLPMAGYYSSMYFPLIT